MSLKEELNIEAKPKDLDFVCLLKSQSKPKMNFINNEFVDLYFFRKNLKVEDMEYQKEELS